MPELCGGDTCISPEELEGLRQKSRLLSHALTFLALQHGCPVPVTGEAPREECYECAEDGPHEGKTIEGIHEDCWLAFFERKEAKSKELEAKNHERTSL